MSHTVCDQSQNQEIMLCPSLVRSRFKCLNTFFVDLVELSAEIGHLIIILIVRRHGWSN